MQNECRKHTRGKPYCRVQGDVIGSASGGQDWADPRPWNCLLEHKFIWVAVGHICHRVIRAILWINNLRASFFGAWLQFEGSSLSSPACRDRVDRRKSPGVVPQIMKLLHAVRYIPPTGYRIYLLAR
jgi:hypothetical protein